MKKIFWILGAATIVAILTAPTPSKAQVVKPHILMIFDTSGSMLFSSCDGQDPPVGDSLDGRTSYIYNLKEAMKEALFFVGTDEANFGLMHFPHMENACNLDACNFATTTAGYYRVILPSSAVPMVIRAAK